MAITFSMAINLAQIELNRIQAYGANYVLLPELAKETQYGWLIPWAQSSYRSSKEVTVGGNAPIFVDRFTGRPFQPAFRGSLEAWLAQYAQEKGSETREGGGNEVPLADSR